MARRGKAQTLQATILVVEDEAGVRGLITKILRDHGATVHACGTGVDAHRAAAGLDRIDLLLTDIVLPDIPGLQVADLVREWHGNMRVVAMSGYLPDQVIGPEVLFLQKPFDATTLVACVRDVLAG
jgi:two-component system, cell cycle sensor histidine kinase and response regulator CckA